VEPAVVKVEERLVTLTDIYYELKGMPSGGISMPSLLNYKKDHLKPGGCLEKFARGKGSRNIRFTGLHGRRADPPH
jgi:hypothetical protein